MTRLLVSVRSACEAVTALAAGAHLMDVKEPSRGPLGPADPAVIRAVCRAVAGRVPVSAALGELAGQCLPRMAAGVAGIQYAKLGLAGCADLPGWADLWARALESCPSAATPIAVIYADWRQHARPVHRSC